MDQICHNSICKTKLKEYRELTSKLYDDIESCEDDLKDKDNFLQKVIKKRNEYESEMVNLKKKLSMLNKEKDELLVKVDQLDEDTDTGVEMLKMAHERERKYKKEVQEYK